MPIKKYNPTTPGRRGMTGLTYEELSGDAPYKPLLAPLTSKAGRNSAGRITVRHQGGGHKRQYRIVDFRQNDKMGIEARVETIEYDPNRTAFIARVVYKDGERRYVLAHKDMKVGDKIVAGEDAKPASGNRLRIANIPTGLRIYNVELIVGGGSIAVRSAGSSAEVISQEGEYTQVRMPSGEVRKVHKNCYATIGVVSNVDNNQVVIGKAGRSRWKGIRPTVLGKSMNAVDHPHGGGEGHSPIGLIYPKTPWGAPALGSKTRKRKDTTKWIIRDKKGKLINKL
jgi:large subunit ribosomal protein L2